MYGGSKVIVEGVDVGHLRLRVTYHIYIVGCGCSPEYPTAPLLRVATLATGDCGEFLVVGNSVLPCGCKGIRQSDFCNLGIVDSFLTDGDKSFWQSDGGDSSLAEGIVVDTCYIICLALVGNLCRYNEVARIGIGIAGTRLAIGGIGKAYFVIGCLCVLDAINGKIYVLCAEGKDGVLSPPLVGLKLVNQFGFHINF